MAINDNTKPAEKIPKPVKCHRCAYEWNTVSLLGYVACPSCGARVKNPHGSYWKHLREQAKKSENQSE